MEKDITEQDHNTNFDGWQYAGFWCRVGAFLADTILLGIIIFPLLHMIYGEKYWQVELDVTLILSYTIVDFFSDYLDSFFRILGLPDFLISWVFPALTIILFWIYKSATPGKMLIDAKVVDAKTGGKLSVARCIARYIGYYISALPFGLGFLWVAFDSKKQGWHDKIAGTVVIRRIEEKVEFSNKKD